MAEPDAGAARDDEAPSGPTDAELASLVAMLVGVTMLVSPLYWPGLTAVGVAALLDPIGALGVVRSGVFYAGLSGGYLTAGVVGFWYATRETPFRRVLGFALLALVPTVAIALGSYALRLGVVTVTPLVLGIGTGATTLGFPLGVAADREGRLLTAGLGVVLVAPYAGWVVVNVGSPSGLAGTYAYLSVGLLALMVVAWGAPLYWLGRRVAAGT